MSHFKFGSAFQNSKYRAQSRKSQISSPSLNLALVDIWSMVHGDLIVRSAPIQKIQELVAFNKYTNGTNTDYATMYQYESDESSVDSAEAFYEFIGISNMDMKEEEAATASENDKISDPSTPYRKIPELLRMSDDAIRYWAVERCNLKETYASKGVCRFPPSLCNSAAIMRQLTEELVWGSHLYPSDKTYETIKLLKNGEIFERRELTRLENFVNTHPEWDSLCNNHLQKIVSHVVGEPMMLYKEKLNIKPAGGSGFAPHLDSPSLRVALGENGPSNFVTVMIAIDNMTSENGCLRLVEGLWTEDNHTGVVESDLDDNPDAGGRAGAIPLQVADTFEFIDMICQGGDIVAFNGWVPHRSAPNRSLFSRRAVFLTYNPLSEGDFHDAYYTQMEKLRSTWSANVGLSPSRNVDVANEEGWLSSVPP
jgi:ectoine hydroxylase-related dioxygenase (phytanoyl-CoA dioxygenase family)